MIFVPPSVSSALWHGRAIFFAARPRALASVVSLGRRSPHFRYRVLVSPFLTLGAPALSYTHTLSLCFGATQVMAHFLHVHTFPFVHLAPLSMESERFNSDEFCEQEGLW